MKALILAAGYGTRLYPLTRNTPKPLLHVGGRPILAYLLDRLEDVSDLKEVYLVTNNKFHNDFRDWTETLDVPWPVQVLNDGTTEDGEKRGAIGDIHFSIEEGNIQDDLLVLGGDNLVDFSLTGMVKTFHQTGTNIVGALRFEEKDKLSRYGILDVKEDGTVTEFVEKPDKPPSNLVSMAMYLFPADRLHLVDQYLDSGGNPDETGWYMNWLVENDTLHAHVFSGTWFDIGDPDSLEKADQFAQEKL